MVTKEHKKQEECLICVSDYHLEMILIPYIKEKLNNSNIIILTENNLEESIKTLLEKINLSDEVKNNIVNLNWKAENNKKIEYLKKISKQEKNAVVIINGKINFINNTEEQINNCSIIEKVKCFHISDQNLNMEEVKRKYKSFLNTEKI